MRDRLTPHELEAWQSDAKVALLATVDGEGLPHVTLITSLEGRDARSLTWGQFTEGLSKAHVRRRPQVGFAVMTLDRQVWRGRARWVGAAKEGPDHERYNRKPMFRYNAYFGIHTVHAMDLVSVEGPSSPPWPRFAAGLLGAAPVALLARSPSRVQALTPWARRFLDHPATLAFGAWIDADGFPVIAPLVPCMAADAGRLVLVPGACPPPRDGFEPGRTLAVFAVNLQAESVLVRGVVARLAGRGPFRTVALDVDYVYNSMPPNHGPVYPPEPLRPVRTFPVPGPQTCVEPDAGTGGEPDAGMGAKR